MELVSIRDYRGEGIPRFDCGEEALNVFLQKYAKQNDKKSLGKTYLGIQNDELVGYFTLSAAMIGCKQLPDAMKKELPHYPIPAIRLARLAVSKAQQGQGYGASLLKEALQKSFVVALSVGVNLIIVDAKESAVGFYEHFGFIKTFESGTLILPIATLGKAIGLLD